MAQLPTPKAEGNLSSNPFAHLLVYISRRGMDGTLVVWPEQNDAGRGMRGQDRIRFEGGVPTGARMLSGGSTLDRSLLQLFARTNAPYAFYDVDLVGEGNGVLTGRARVLSLVAASLRGAARTDAIDKVLGAFGDTRIRLKSSAPLRDYDLTHDEEIFLDIMRADAATVPDLIASSGDKRLARRMLYLLTITHAVAPFDGPTSEAPGRHSDHPPTGTPLTTRAVGRGRSLSPPSGTMPKMPSKHPGAVSFGSIPAFGMHQSSPDPAPAAPEGLPKDKRDRWLEIAKRVDNIDKQTYFAMLGLETTANEAQVRDAYFDLVKRWHPDRLPPELFPLRPWVDRVFYHLTKAKDTLSDRKDRVEYLKSVQAGGGTPASDRQVNAVVEAAMQFNKAEILMKRGDWNEALEIVREIQSMNPEDADYPATEGWILYQDSIAEMTPDYAPIYEALDRALAINPDHEKAMHYKAVAMKREGGRDAEAIRLFRKVASINPRNIEAVRQVRLANMRKKEEGGFLSKLFGSGDDSKKKNKKRR